MYKQRTIKKMSKHGLPNKYHCLSKISFTYSTILYSNREYLRSKNWSFVISKLDIPWYWYDGKEWKHSLGGKVPNCF